MNKTLKLAILLFGVATTILIMILSCDSYERRMARIEKNATEFKQSMGEDEKILIEVIDSVVQKIYYAVYYYETEGINYSELKAHNYATNETKSVISAPMQIGDYYFGGEYGACFGINEDTKLFGNRFFIITWTEASGRGIFYIDISNDSVHFVEDCSQAEFSKVNDNILVTRECYVNGKWESRNYELSMSLDDEAYALNRKKQKEKDKRMENDIKEREIREWIFGTWDWTGYIYGTRTWSRLRISTTIIESLSPDGVLDEGTYQIDLDNNVIYFGKYSNVKFDCRKKLLYFDDGEPYRKVSNTLKAPPVSYGSGNTNTRTNYSVAIFGTDTEVIVYTGSHYFKNRMGNRIKINFQGMYLNGNLVTNAPRVLRFSGSIAIISVSSPYNGGGAMILTVDASRGTITDGSGDVFYIMN